jgi:hypothetical protein
VCVVVPSRGDAVDLVEEQDGSIMVRRGLKESAKDLLALSVPLAEYLRAADLEERCLCLVGDDSCEHRLSGARQAREQDAFDWSCTNLGKGIAMLERQLDEFPSTVDDCPQTTEVIERQAGLAVGQPELVNNGIVYGRQVEIADRLFVQHADDTRKVTCLDSVALAVVRVIDGWHSLQAAARVDNSYVWQLQPNNTHPWLVRPDLDRRGDQFGAVVADDYEHHITYGVLERRLAVRRSGIAIPEFEIEPTIAVCHGADARQRPDGPEFDVSTLRQSDVDVALTSETSRITHTIDRSSLR